jgi:hypothetical protein
MFMEQIISDTSYQYTNGIHEFVFLKGSRRAVDEYLAELRRIFESASSDSTVKVLLDIRQTGLPPIAYLSAQIHEWHKECPSVGMTYTAILYSGSSALMLLKNLTRLFSRNGQEQVRFFEQDRRDEAMAWMSNNVVL